jgi:hypothetical protein
VKIDVLSLSVAMNLVLPSDSIEALSKKDPIMERKPFNRQTDDRIDGVDNSVEVRWVSDRL